MMKQILVLLAIVFLLSGCEKQQENTKTIFNRETAKDFTTKKAPNVMPAPPAMLPGKAQILGAPFSDYKTQTGRAEVAPKKDMFKPIPE